MMRSRAHSSRTSGSTALRIAIVAALVAIGIALVFVLSKRADDTHAPIVPHGDGGTATHPIDGGTRTTAPDPDEATGGNTHVSTSPAGAGDTWRIAGHVRGHKAVAVADADVRLEMTVAGETRTLGSTRTAADGSYALDAPALGALDALSASLCQVSIAVTAAHRAPARAQSGFDLNATDRTVHLDVRVDEGERLTGRIVDAHAKPVAQATVRLSVASTKGGASGFALVQEVTTGNDGRFDVGFSSTAHYHLSSRADGVGTAFVDALDLEAGAGRDLGDVALAGGEPISGTVVHAGTTEPAAFFDVWVFDADFAAQSDALALVVQRAVDVERGDGLTYTHAWTDAQGHFDLRGLRPGQYALRSPDARAVLEPHQARFEPGTKGLDLQLFSSCIVVRVRDEDGVPVRGANVRLTDLTTLADGTYGPAGSHIVTSRGPEATAVFCIDPEAPCAIDAYTQTRRSAEEFVTLSQNEFVHEVALVLPRKAATGRIQLDLQGEDGKPLEHLQAELLSNVTRARREDVGVLESDEHGLLPPVPCGTYELFVGYAPGTDRDHFPIRTQQPVTVVTGAPVRVTLRPHRGARVRIELGLDGPAPAGLAAVASPGTRPLSDDEKRTRFGVTFVASRTDGGASRNLQFSIGGQEAGGKKGAVESHLLPGESATSLDVLEPGTVTVTISGTTMWTSTPVPLALVAGQTATADFTLRAR